MIVLVLVVLLEEQFVLQGELKDTSNIALLMSEMGKSVAAGLILFILALSFLFVVQPVSASENSWSEIAPVPGKYQGTLGAAVVDGKIYFLGSSINLQYDPATDNWTTKTPNPSFVYQNNAAVAVCQNKIYIIGGTVNEVYDPATDSWENKTSMPTERYALKANVLDGKIYVISGQVPGPPQTVYPSDVTEVYDPENDSWTALAKIPFPVVSYASAVLDDKIYIIGGTEWGTPSPFALTRVQIFDPKTNQWTQGTPLEEAVSGAAATATTGLSAPKRIYVVGGNIINAGYNIRYSDHVQIFDLESQKWFFGAQMPTGRTNLALANVNDTLYALGGRNSSVTVSVAGDATQEEWEAAYDKIASMQTHANEKYCPIGYSEAVQTTSSPSTSQSPLPTELIDTNPSANTSLPQTPAPSLPLVQTASSSPSSSEPTTEPVTAPVELAYAGVCAVPVLVAVVLAVKLRKKKK